VRRRPNDPVVDLVLDADSCKGGLSDVGPSVSAGARPAVRGDSALWNARGRCELPAAMSKIKPSELRFRALSPSPA
jgi:hypothetical protein